MSKFIIANWKMYPPTYKEADKLVSAAEATANKNRKVNVVVCPPFTWLTDFSHKPHGRLAFGAQNSGPEMKSGPYTGEVSPSMLKSSGVKYVILGHSERRAMGETDALIAKKMTAAIRGGLTPVLCVGEPLAIRKQGRAAVLTWVRRQLHNSVKGVPRTKQPIIVAYEPIWAISTNEGLPCDPEEAELMVNVCAAHVAIQEKFGEALGLYGGSVTSRDAKGYIDRERIDGLLVGHDSLNPKHFAKIVELAETTEY